MSVFESRQDFEHSGEVDSLYGNKISGYYGKKTVNQRNLGKAVNDMKKNINTAQGQDKWALRQNAANTELFYEDARVLGFTNMIRQWTTPQKDGTVRQINTIAYIFALAGFWYFDYTQLFIVGQVLFSLGDVVTMQNMDLHSYFVTPQLRNYKIGNVFY